MGWNTPTDTGAVLATERAAEEAEEADSQSRDKALDDL